MYLDDACVVAADPGLLLEGGGGGAPSTDDESYADTHKLNHPTGKPVPDKTEEQRALIELALHQNSLFTCLDEEQISKYVSRSYLSMSQRAIDRS